VTHTVFINATEWKRGSQKSACSRYDEVCPSDRGRCFFPTIPCGPPTPAPLPVRTGRGPYAPFWVKWGCPRTYGCAEVLADGRFIGGSPSPA
jgi:hypothetical protein